MLDQFITYFSHPLGIALALILISYLLEDLAIVSGALLAAEGSIPLELSLLAVFIGIASGDFGLYALGAFARRWRRLKGSLLLRKQVRLLRRQLKQNTFNNIFLIRFLPGARSLGYTLCGFFQVPLWSFGMAVFLATGLWTALVFFSVYQLGASEWLSGWSKWVLVPVVLIALAYSNKLVSFRLKEQLA